MLKVGILGGTFDPPHYGHLIIAQEVLDTLELDEIWFMPTNIPPHKKEAASDSNDRINMIEEAISGHSNFSVQPIELNRNGPSYTYDTIKLLSDMYPKHVFYFIIGGDMVEYLPKWYQINQLISMVKFVGVNRPGYTLSTEYPIITVETPQLDISSSELRRRFKNKLSTRYFLPDNVRNYIKEKHLYGS